MTNKVIDKMEIETEKHVNEKGMSWPLTSIFIIGHCAGAGMLAMPLGFASMGIETGFFLAVLCATISLYTGLQLGWMWQIMQKIWPEYRNKCQNPYGEMAYRAIGRKTRTMTELMIYFAQLGYMVILILLAAKNVSILSHFFFGIKINQCALILIVSFFVWPSLMLGSPMDFWQIALISSASSWLAVILIVVGIIEDSSTCTQDVPHDTIDLFKSFMSYGSMVFAYAAHPTFPTFQHDMKKPSQFSYSLYLTWIVITIYYLTLSSLGYYVYGSSVGDAIITSIQNVTIQQLINLMFAIHVISTIVLAASTPFQQFEKFFNIPHKFGWKRFLLRSSVFFCVVFTAITFPHFGPMMDLLGSSMNSAICMILPPLFYLFLRTQSIIRQQQKSCDQSWRPSMKQVFETTPKPILFLNILVMCFGLFAGLLATISAFYTFADSKLAPPCYVQYWRNGLSFSDKSSGSVNCCGNYRNLTVFGDDPNGFCTFNNFS